MIDIHCHILHDMDDGPKRLEESVALLKMAEENYVDQIVLTPHMTNLYDVEGFLGKRDGKMAELKRTIDQLELELSIFPGAEVYVNDDIFYAAGIHKLSINGSRYLLVEFQYANLSESRLIKYVNEIIAQGLIPIIAHPERYQYFQKNQELMEYIAQMGALYQVNASGLLGHDGKAERKLSRHLIRTELASFLASDAHSIQYRPNRVLNEIQDIDPTYLNKLLNDNPSLVLHNQNMAQGKGLLPV